MSNKAIKKDTENEKKKTGRKWKWAVAGILSIFLIAILCTACNGAALSTEEPVKTQFFGMDTSMTFTAYGEGAEEALKDAEEKMAELESLWSVTDENSEIYQVNHSQGKAVTVSNETAEIVRYALAMAEKTDGALEPTIYPVLTAWGFTTGENHIPAEEELEKLMPLVGYDKVRIDGNQIQLLEGMELDLGAVGKGYAGDLVADILRKKRITSALLDIGGNIQAVGSRPDGNNWRLGIRNPFGEGSLGVLEISDKAVVTSGAYERYFVGEDGKGYGHILDPATGSPADNDLAAVTIIADEGKQGDALSTALFVKGLEGAKAYWQEHRDFEMLLVTKNGEIYLTEGVKDDFSISGNLSNMKIHVLNQL